MTTITKRTTGCCIVGGGPGGMILALLLARQGIEVTLLEAHPDFDRDFRGDTIHPSTLELLDRLGLAHELHQIPHGKLRQFGITAGHQHYTMADFARLPTRYPYIMMLPQAQFLEFLARHARRYPHLRIEMAAQVHQLIREGDAVRGVHYRQDGVDHELRATLTVAADGRFSKLRKLVGLEPRRTSPPMDIVWLRLPRVPSDPGDQGVMVDRGRLCVLLQRPTEWQIGLVIPKGGYQELRSQGLPSIQQELAAVVPWLADRVALLNDWHAMTLLAVESSRLARWYVPGMLLIGDAAHVMSPVGGVGINYAIQDAVAAAYLLAKPLRQGRVEIKDLAAVQRRREWPVKIIQAIQGFMQRNLIAEGLDRGKPFRFPLALRVLLRIPLLRDLPGRIIGLGIGREPIQPEWPGV